MMINHAVKNMGLLIILCMANINTCLANSIVADQSYDDYKAQSPAFSLITINEINWIGNNCFVTFADNSTIPAARIIDPNKDKISDLTEACALRFDIEPKRTNTVNIDGIIVKVESYSPLPENLSLETSRRYEEADIYYAEIDDPWQDEGNYFKTELVKNDKVVDDSFILGDVYLKKDEPEPFIIRINAKTPGIYTFSCMILARYQNSKERIILTGEKDEPFKFAFIK